MKRITALAHQLMDISVSCGAHFLHEHGLTPGTYGLLHAGEQDALLGACSAIDRPMSVGGTAVNSVMCARLLGVAGTVLGLVGDDPYGHNIYKQLKARDIQCPLPHAPHARTGTCLCLITPDGERTMRTCLGVNTECNASHVHESAIAGSEWLLLEGYFLTASEKNAEALHAAISVAKSAGTKVAFLASAEFVIDSKKEEILTRILPHTDLLFCNEGEARSLTGAGSTESAVSAIASRVPNSVVTRGGDGAVISMGAARFSTPAVAVASGAIDTTGAGDVFAGAFLAGLLRGLSPEVSAQGAAKLASIVVQRQGPQLPEDAKEAWEKIVASA